MICFTYIYFVRILPRSEHTLFFLLRFVFQGLLSLFISLKTPRSSAWKKSKFKLQFQTTQTAEGNGLRLLACLTRKKVFFCKFCIYNVCETSDFEIRWCADDIQCETSFLFTSFFFWIRKDRNKKMHTRTTQLFFHRTIFQTVFC